MVGWAEWACGWRRRVKVRRRRSSVGKGGGGYRGIFHDWVYYEKIDGEITHL